MEIGPGAGPNLVYYPRDVRWIGVEPNPALYPYLRREAGRLGVAIVLRDGAGESLPAEDNSVDAVVSTLVLCSVTDPARTLQEIKRALKPGGRFVFYEHVAAPRGTWLRRVQAWVTPLWSLLEGCHPNRETWATIEQAGFGQVHLEHFELPTGISGPHIAGMAVK